MVRRSRELWDEARRADAPKTALLRAILYELQPIRFSSIDISSIQRILQSFARSLTSLVTQTVPSFVGGSFRIARSMSLRQWSWIVGAVAYFYGIRYIHRVLDAGPMVLILSALVALFTIGLDDDASGDGVSAYSVFNRGFQRLLGSVDVEALVAQHVGGAMGVAGVGLAAAPQQQEEENNNVHPPGNLGVARRPPDRNEEEEADEDGAPQPRSRKSGKKARRGNLEQRREAQRQRQAAMDMGFAGDGGPEEMMAMQQLLEEQIAANAGNNRDE